MIVKGFVAAFAVGLGLMLGSCSPFAGAVADHWPHFAGGEPDGLPPRPGTPGYAAFIAHGQPSQQVPDAAPAAIQQTTPIPNAAHVENTAATERAPAPPRPAPPAQEQEPNAPDPDAVPDTNALRGGLY